ncbi:hypothetical protein E2C01_052600 [Portunus trituberculatus]|uniref:Uncharacterized protein n=1 Tax=Portunus trituberculatus TaxID=210409 RepID=A0A5B7GM70_PORTR|nr:hypothetical protein [Portunus trituberculatus]
MELVISQTVCFINVLHRLPPEAVMCLSSIMAERMTFLLHFPKLPIEAQVTVDSHVLVLSTAVPLRESRHQYFTARKQEEEPATCVSHTHCAGVYHVYTVSSNTSDRCDEVLVLCVQRLLFRFVFQ